MKYLSVLFCICISFTSTAVFSQSYKSPYIFRISQEMKNDTKFDYLVTNCRIYFKQCVSRNISSFHPDYQDEIGEYFSSTLFDYYDNHNFPNDIFTFSNKRSLKEKIKNIVEMNLDILEVAYFEANIYSDEEANHFQGPIDTYGFAIRDKKTNEMILIYYLY